MSKPSRPHLAWTAAALLAVAVLSVAAWWLWSRPGSPPADESTAHSDGSPVPQGPDSASQAAAADMERKAAIEVAERAMAAGQFGAASEALDEAEDRVGFSEELRATGTQLALRETAYREALRPIEFRIESIVVGTEDESAELYARYTVEGVPVFASELLAPTTHEQSVEGAREFQRSHVAVLRTSFARGLSLEIMEPGGIFESDDVLFGPIPLSPLPNTEGGQLTYTEVDARVRSVTVGYRSSPFEPGVHIDGRLPLPPADATASHLVDAINSALQRDDLERARLLKGLLEKGFPANKTLAFLEGRIEDLTENLRQNRTRATFTILELAVDPRPDGDDKTTLWASGGDAPSFRASIRTTDGQVLAESEDARTALYLIPGGTLPAPESNVLKLFARGTAPLTLVVKDSSPTFSSRVVGDIDLPVTLSQLPRGSGTIVVERLRSVLIQPGSEPNRIRRIVLRWNVVR